MKIAINGFGNIGKLIVDALNVGVSVIEPDRRKWTIPHCAYVQNVHMLATIPDVIIDFSVAKALDDLVDYGEKMRVPLVIASTGHSVRQIERIKSASESIPVFYSANMASSMPSYLAACLSVGKGMHDAKVHIHEIHRASKIDAPSGTAIMIANYLTRLEYIHGYRVEDDGEDGVISISYERVGDVIGVHRVTFEREEDSVTLEHKVKDRSVFAKGAIAAAQYISLKRSGLYGIENLTEAYEICQDRSMR